MKRLGCHILPNKIPEELLSGCIVDFDHFDLAFGDFSLFLLSNFPIERAEAGHHLHLFPTASPRCDPVEKGLRVCSGAPFSYMRDEDVDHVRGGHISRIDTTIQWGTRFVAPRISSITPERIDHQFVVVSVVDSATDRHFRHRPKRHDHKKQKTLPFSRTHQGKHLLVRDLFPRTYPIILCDYETISAPP